jgi:hypothetical protein
MNIFLINKRKILWIVIITLLIFTGCRIPKTTSTLLSSSVSHISTPDEDVIQLTPITVLPPLPVINRSQALARAAGYIPPEINERSNIGVEYDFRTGSNGAWIVTISIPEAVVITREQLLKAGWEEIDFHTSDINFKELFFDIDAVTGDIINKIPIGINSVTIGPYVPPLISSEQAKTLIAEFVPSDIIEQARILSIPSNSPGINAYFIYLITNVYPDQLDWQSDSKTYLDNLEPGQPFFELEICVEANTGDLIKRAAFAISRH